MKTTTKALLTLVVLAVLGASTASAYDRNPHYRYGHNGYWDEHHGYHHWDHYHGHDGYWYNRPDGVRIFINV